MKFIQSFFNTGAATWATTPPRFQETPEYATSTFQQLKNPRLWETLTGCRLV